jgi:hypothetical protein
MACPSSWLNGGAASLRLFTSPMDRSCHIRLSPDLIGEAQRCATGKVASVEEKGLLTRLPTAYG